MTERYVPPTQEEIARVANYWTRVKKLSCDHKYELTISMDDMSCSNCSEKMIMMSAIQKEEWAASLEGSRMALQRLQTMMLEKLRARGGVVLTLPDDPDSYDIRVSMIRYPGFAGEGHPNEYPAISLDDLEVLLKATGVQ